MRRENPPHGAGSRLGSGMRLPIEVPPSGPLYEGHFPGRAILPGIGLLDLALRALAAAGASSAVREIVTLRLRRLVAPGDLLELDVKSLSPDGRARLEVRRTAEVVATGVVLLGEPSPGTASTAPSRDLPSRAGRAVRGRDPRPSSPLPNLDDLLPHRPPMLMVEGIERETEDGVLCAVRLHEESAFTDRGSAPALVALEMAAQSAAAFEALHRRRETGEPGARIGYLVGARDVRFAYARVPAFETLTAEIRLEAVALPLSTYTFGVMQASTIVASGTLSTWLTAKGA